MTWKAMYRLGRLANGAERDKGHTVHAVPTGTPYSRYRAFCGAQPGPRSVGWQAEDGLEVTCSRCLRRLADPVDDLPRWRVERWGGGSHHQRRVVFAGDEATARAKWQQLHLELRQGTVDLIDPDGRMVERSKRPRLRTRW
jgi:hypothetical protein